MDETKNDSKWFDWNGLVWFRFVWFSLAVKRWSFSDILFRFWLLSNSKFVQLKMLTCMYVCERKLFVLLLFIYHHAINTRTRTLFHFDLRTTFEATWRIDVNITKVIDSTSSMCEIIARNERISKVISFSLGHLHNGFDRKLLLNTIFWGLLYTNFNYKTVLVYAVLFVFGFSTRLRPLIFTVRKCITLLQFKWIHDSQIGAHLQFKCENRNKNVNLCLFCQQMFDLKL